MTAQFGVNNGDYDKQPTNWIRVAPLSALMMQSVVRIQVRGPTREQADALYRQFVEWAANADDLEKIEAKLLAINFADDAVNPPELGVLEAGVARIKGARCVIVPASPQSQGHYTSMQAALWKGHLAEFLGEAAMTR
jgi:homoserine O-acetyltransferase